MGSLLIITSVKKLQSEINQAVRNNPGIPGIYVSLNKSQASIENILKDNNVATQKLFFIDCVTSEKTRDDVLHIKPNNLSLLSTAIEAFVNDIEQKKFMIIDALSTLLIYNDENKVAQFAKTIAEMGSKHDLEIIAFSPATKGEELMNKIFNFFDKVEQR